MSDIFIWIQKQTQPFAGAIYQHRFHDFLAVTLRCFTHFPIFRRQSTRPVPGLWSISTSLKNPLICVHMCHVGEVANVAQDSIILEIPLWHEIIDAEAIFDPWIGLPLSKILQLILII
ncbi:hypothetical protein ACJX0J_036315, partial [Zea mays]